MNMNTTNQYIIYIMALYTRIYICGLRVAVEKYGNEREGKEQQVGKREMPIYTKYFPMEATSVRKLFDIKR